MDPVTPNSGEETRKIFTQYLSLMFITSFWKRVILLLWPVLKQSVQCIEPKDIKGIMDQHFPILHTQNYDIVSKYSSSVNRVIYYLILIALAQLVYLTAGSYFRNNSISFELSWAKWVDSSRTLKNKYSHKLHLLIPPIRLYRIYTCRSHWAWSYMWHSIIRNEWGLYRQWSH